MEELRRRNGESNPSFVASPVGQRRIAMNPKTLSSVSRVFGACLGLSVCAWLLAAQLVAPGALERWRVAWLLLCSIGIAGVVLPLAVAHALLAAWADEVIERIDGLL